MGQNNKTENERLIEHGMLISIYMDLRNEKRITDTEYYRTIKALEKMYLVVNFVEAA